ncbi:unnamed protein product [Mycena citricolor]|uniref:Uncharacterized protein n=1 Tax=Mycena citricolor TaxID=2018698 RepID=A0AAD2Q6P7_9AGAR|nr:unnamed protein product [Mycena citricolor]CAK5282426.1 unnamed protein product [Mycena citricolor]
MPDAAKKGFPPFAPGSPIPVPGSAIDACVVVICDVLNWAGGPLPEIPPAAHGMLTVRLLLQIGRVEKVVSFDGSQANECYGSRRHGSLYGSHQEGIETHPNIVALMDMTGPGFLKLRADTHKLIDVLPLYLIYALTRLLHYSFTRGCPMVITHRFDSASFYVAAALQYKLMICLVVPPILVVPVRHPYGRTQAKEHHSSLFGAAPSSPHLFEAASWIHGQSLPSEPVSSGQAVIHQKTAWSELISNHSRLESAPALFA